MMHQIDLPFLAKEELPDLVAGQIRKVFMLKTVKRKDPFLEQFHFDFAQLGESPEWSFLEIVSSTEDHVNHVRSKLMEFAAETDHGPSVQRFISTSPYHEDSQIVTDSLEISDEDLAIRGTQLLKRGNPSVYLLQAEKRIDIVKNVGHVLEPIHSCVPNPTEYTHIMYIQDSFSSRYHDKTLCGTRTHTHTDFQKSFKNTHTYQKKWASRNKKTSHTLSERLRMIRERISQFKDKMMMNEPHKVNRQRSRDNVG